MIMKELNPYECFSVVAGGDTFAADAGQYFGGFVVGFILGGGQLPVAIWLGAYLGSRQAIK
jgi:hypothetical protein